MKRLFCVADEEYKAFFNVDAICMFRLKYPENGRAIDANEAEITFIGGSKTKLNGESAKHFVQAMTDLLGGI